MTYILSFSIAMVVSMALLPGLIYVGERFSFVDQPNDRKVHRTPIPRIGGLAIFAGVATAAAWIYPAPFTSDTLVLVCAGALVLLVGFIDDRRELRFAPKLIAQLVSAIVIVYGLDIHIKELSLPLAVSLPNWFSYPLSVLVVVSITNAVALSDGLDGLAGGIVFLCSAALAVMAYSTGNTATAILAIALSGAIFGFLRFNSHPASVFMGDCGSQFLGLAVAVLALEVTQSDAGRIGASLPLLLLAIPIIDTAQVIVTRLKNGKSPFVADKNHLHHRLLALGLSHRQAVLSIYVAQCGFFLLGYYLRFESDGVVLTVFAAVSALILGSLYYAKRSGLQSHRIGIADKQEHPRYIFDRLARYSALTISAALLAYVALLVFASSREPESLLSGGINLAFSQIQSLTLLLLGVALTSVVISSNLVASLCHRGAGYVLAAILAFLASSFQWPMPFAAYEALLLLIIVAGAVTWFATTANAGVRISSLDILVLFAALVIPNLSALNADLEIFAMLILRLVCLFYAAEIISYGLRPGIEARAPLSIGLTLIALQPIFIEMSR